VAVAQLPDMLGITVTGTRTPVVLWHALAGIPRAHPATVTVALAVMLIVLVARRIGKRVPGALIAIVGAIIVSRDVHLAQHGVAVIGPFPHGLPALGFPSVSAHDVRVLIGPAVSMFVIIVAQSAATARIYAARYHETDDTNADLVGLGAANIASALSGTFVVNGSPTQTQSVVTAGGRSQFAQLTTSAVVIFVLLLLTGPLSDLPVAALAAVVFLIAIRLIDLREMRRIAAVRPEEFAIALLATAAVVVLGVEDGIILAIAASIIDHLRHSYHPTNSVLVKSPGGHWRTMPVRPGARTEDGLVVYRFGTSLYYANASWLAPDITALVAGDPLRWLVFDSAAIGDVDYTAATVLRRVIKELTEHRVRLVLTSVVDPVRRQYDRYGITALVGEGAYYDTPGAALEAFEASVGDPGEQGPTPADE
jgi:sulfate permease, SulP family